MTHDIFVIKSHRITEKATDLSKAGKYVFMVRSDATKPEVKKAVQKFYNVKVRGVNITRIPGKPRRFRNVKRLSSGYKKAIVTLKAGEKIDIGV